MTTMKGSIYELILGVRDYECDMQGVVNNAIYQNYLEHTRHEFILSLGESFAEWTARGFTPMVSKAEIEYKSPLRSGDKFSCQIALKRQGARYIFLQEIHRLSDQKICIKARIEVTSISNGKLTRGDEFAKLFAPFLHENE